MVDLKYSETGTSPRDLILKLWQGKFIIAALALLGTGIALGYYHYYAVPKYTAQAVIMVQPSDKEKLISNRSTPEGSSLDTDIELLKSYPVSEGAVNILLNSEQRTHLELFGTRQGGKKASNAANWQSPDAKKMRGFTENLQGKINVENIKGTPLLKVSVSSRYPEEAALLANTVCVTYQQKDTEWNAAQDMSVSRIIDQQIEQQKKKVEGIEREFSSFMKNQEIYQETGNVGEIQNGSDTAEKEYNSNRVQYAILKNQLSFVDRQLSETENIFSKNLTQNLVIKLRSIRDSLKSQESAYIKLALQKGPDDPDVRAAREQMKVLKANYEEIVRKKVAGELANAGSTQKLRFDLIASKMQVQIKLSELDNSAQEFLKMKNYYQSQLSQLPQKQITFAKLKLDHEVANKTYAFLKERLDESRIKVASNAGRIVILKPALIPAEPDSINLKKSLLIGFGAGVILGLSIVFGVDWFKNVFSA
jgi:succinoglycan biosynthesis transport protein ExoP